MINIFFFLIFQVQFTALLFREKTKKLEQQIAAADTEIKKTYTLPRREKKGFPLLWSIVPTLWAVINHSRKDKNQNQIINTTKKYY